MLRNTSSALLYGAYVAPPGVQDALEDIEGPYYPDTYQVVGNKDVSRSC